MSIKSKRNSRNLNIANRLLIDETYWTPNIPVFTWTPRACRSSCRGRPPRGRVRARRHPRAESHGYLPSQTFKSINYCKWLNEDNLSESWKKALRLPIMSNIELQHTYFRYPMFPLIWKILPHARGVQLLRQSGGHVVKREKILRYCHR